MQSYNPSSTVPVQISAREILKTMYNAPPTEELRWSAELLAKALQVRPDFTLPLVREALRILHENRYVLRVPAGHELTEKGKREAERLRQLGHAASA